MPLDLNEGLAPLCDQQELEQNTYIQVLVAVYSIHAVQFYRLQPLPHPACVGNVCSAFHHFALSNYPIPNKIFTLLQCETIPLHTIAPVELACILEVRDEIFADGAELEGRSTDPSVGRWTTAQWAAILEPTKMSAVLAKSNEVSAEVLCSTCRHKTNDRVISSVDGQERDPDCVYGLVT